MKRISVIVPIFNSAKTLDKCIKSIINQSIKSLEILLIDDGSTDSSGKICDNYSKIDSRIKVIHKKNGGVSSARNVGLNHATGEYISFIDSDDYIEHNMFELLLKNIEKNKCDIAICNLSFEDTSCKEIYEFRHDNFLFLKENYPINSYYIKSISGYVCNKLFSRKMIYLGDSNIEFNSNIFLGEDDLFNYEIIKLNNKIRYTYIDNKLYHYVTYNDSATNQKFNYKKLTYFDAKLKEINILNTNDYDSNFLKADFVINFVRTKLIMKKMKIEYNDKYYEIEKKSIEYKKQIQLNKIPVKHKIKYIISVYFPFIYMIKLWKSKN